MYDILLNFLVILWKFIFDLIVFIKVNNMTKKGANGNNTKKINNISAQHNQSIFDRYKIKHNKHPSI